MVGRGDLLQGLALMSLLAARRLVRWSAQALGPGGARRFFEPVARRRLAAVRTVQPEPPLKLGDPRLQSRDLRRLRRDQRNQLFTRRLALRIRIRTHRILESKADSAVEKNLPAQPPRHATINLGSYEIPFGAGRNLRFGTAKLPILVDAFTDMRLGVLQVYVVPAQAA